MISNVSLADASDFILDGTHSSPERVEDGIPVLSAQNVTGGALNFQTDRFTTQSEYDAFNRRINLKGGDVLLTIVGTIGRCAVVSEVRPLVFQRSVAIIRPQQNVLDGHYLYHAIQSPNFEAQLSRATNRSSQPGVYLGKLGKITLRLPPLADQQRIGTILDQADNLCRQRELALERVEGLAQSLFGEMFGDPRRNPNKWKLVRLGDVLHSVSDGPHVSPTYVEDGVPFLSTRHIKPGEVVWEDLKFITRDDAETHWKKCKPERGDILYTKGGTTGIAAAVDFDREIAVWVHVALLKPKKELVVPEWLEAMLNSSFCYRQSQKLTHGIANRDLGLTRMVNIEMFLPPRSMQEEFSRRVDMITQVKATQRVSSTKLQVLCRSLQKRAFSGEALSLCVRGHKML